MVERIAVLAMTLGRDYLATYGATRSRHDFTQRQLMACLILRAYLKTTYRGITDLLAGHTGLRTALGMTDKIRITPRCRNSVLRGRSSPLGSRWWGGSGKGRYGIARPKVVSRRGCYGCDGAGDKRGQCPFFEPGRSCKAYMVKSIVDGRVWQLISAGLGGGLGAE